jgi:hypothetical protein
MQNRTTCSHDTFAALNDINLFRQQLIEFSEMEAFYDASLSLSSPAVPGLHHILTRAAELQNRIAAILSDAHGSCGCRTSPGNASSSWELRIAYNWLTDIIQQLERMMFH